MPALVNLGFTNLYIKDDKDIPLVTEALSKIVLVERGNYDNYRKEALVFAKSKISIELNISQEILTVEELEVLKQNFNKPKESSTEE